MFDTSKEMLIALFNKEKKLILIGLIVGLLAFGFYRMFLHTPLYTTKCKIYVKNIAKSDLVTSFEGGGSLVSESGHSNPLFNLYEILKSENLSNKIYAVIKDKYPQDLNALRVDSEESFFNSYAGLINANAEPSTDIIILKLDWPSKKRAPLVLYEILKKFKKENLIIKKTGETQKREFIDKQTMEISNKLEDVRSRIKNYKQSERIVNVEVETKNIISKRMDLENKLHLIDSNIEYNKRKLKEFAAELKIDDATAALLATSLGTDPYLVKLNQNVADASQKYANLKARFKGKYPEMVAVNNEIKQLEKLIDIRKKEISANIKVPRAIYDHTSSIIATKLAETQAEMVSLQSQKQALQKNINKLKRREHSLPLLQLNLNSLTKLEDALADAYKSVKEKQLEAKIKENEIIDNIIVLNNPSNPYSSKLLIFTKFLGFLLIGGLGGMTGAYLKQAYEDKWSNTDEIKIATGKHIFGSIPWLDNFEGETEKNIMNAAYTNIAKEVMSKADSSKSSVISFLSTGKYKSKSAITSSIAKMIEQMEKSVLFIDLTSQNLADFNQIDDLKKKYDYIFINAPHGFVLLPEIQALKEQSEGIVVISGMETRKQEFMQFLHNLRESESKVLGIIVREENSELEQSFKMLEEKENIDPEDPEEQVAFNV